MGVDLPELVVGDLADEAGLEAERGQARRGVAGRSAADLAPRRPSPRRAATASASSISRIEPLAAPACQEGVVGVGDDVDDGIADARARRSGAWSWNGGPAGEVRLVAARLAQRRSAASGSKLASGSLATTPMRRLILAVLSSPPARPARACPGTRRTGPRTRQRSSDAQRHDRQRADRAFRQAAAAGREGDGTKLQFAGPDCVLDAYLYPPAGGGTPRVDPCRRAQPPGQRRQRAELHLRRSKGARAAPAPTSPHRRPPGRRCPHAARPPAGARRRRYCPRRSGNCGSSALTPIRLIGEPENISRKPASSSASRSASAGAASSARGREGACWPAPRSAKRFHGQTARQSSQP